MLTRTPDEHRSSAAEYVASLVRHALELESGVTTADDRPVVAPIGVGEDVVLEVIRAHRVSSCLSGALSQLSMPEALADGIREQQAASVRASLPIQSATAYLTMATQEAGLRCLAYKGVALAERTTGDPSARGFGDVDLLVDPADMPRFHRLLERIGATLLTGWTPTPGSALWPWAARVRPEAPYRWHGVDIDVHWRLDPLPEAMSTPFGQLWESRAFARIGGAVVPTLGPVDALLATCVHGTKEHWRQWRWSVDVVRQVRLLPPGEWPRLKEAAEHCGADVSLAIGLAVAERLTGRSAPLIPGRWARAQAEEAWAEGISGTTPFGRITAAKQFQRLGWTVRTRPDDRALLSLATQLAWSTQDMAEVPLPVLLLPVYPVLRPFLWWRRLARQ